MTGDRWPDHILQLVPNAIHVHHASRFPESRCSGKQSRAEVAKFAADRGLRSVVLTPHVGNPDPGMPRRVAEDSELGMALTVYARSERQTLYDVMLYDGLEDNILQDGALCATASTLADADYVIASFHGTVPETVAYLEERLITIGQNPYVDLIGHPQRYMERMDGIDWEKIFIRLRIDGKAAEANVNAWHNYGPNKLIRKGQLTEAAEAAEFQRAFYAAMGRSGIPVVVSLDIHEYGMWPSGQPEADWMPTVAQLESYLQMLIDEGITEKQISNHSVEEYIAKRRSRLAASTA